jgi:hypothetical protein
VEVADVPQEMLEPLQFTHIELLCLGLKVLRVYGVARAPGVLGDADYFKAVFRCVFHAGFDGCEAEANAQRVTAFTHESELNAFCCRDVVDFYLHDDLALFGFKGLRVCGFAALPVRRFVLVSDRYAEASYHCSNHRSVVVVTVDFHEVVAFGEKFQFVRVILHALREFGFTHMSELALLVEFEFVGIDEKFFVLADESLDNHLWPRLLFVSNSNIHTLHTFRNSFIVKFSFTIYLIIAFMRIFA